MDARDEALARLEDRRRAAAARAQEVRQSIARETGFLPAGTAWMLPLVAFAAGLAVAGMLRRR